MWLKYYIVVIGNDRVLLRKRRKRELKRNSRTPPPQLRVISQQFVTFPLSAATSSRTNINEIHWNKQLNPVPAYKNQDKKKPIALPPVGACGRDLYRLVCKLDPSASIGHKVKYVSSICVPVQWERKLELVDTPLRVRLHYAKSQRGASRALRSEMYL